jgi:hypothetical protein
MELRTTFPLGRESKELLNKGGIISHAAAAATAPLVLVCGRERIICKVEEEGVSFSSGQVREDRGEAQHT